MLTSKDVFFVIIFVMRNGVGFLASVLLRHGCFHHVAPERSGSYYVGQDSSEFVVIFLSLTLSATGMWQRTQSIIVHDLRLFCPDIWNNYR